MNHLSNARLIGSLTAALWALTNLGGFCVRTDASEPKRFSDARFDPLTEWKTVLARKLKSDFCDHANSVFRRSAKQFRAEVCIAVSQSGKLIEVELKKSSHNHDFDLLVLSRVYAMNGKSELVLPEGYRGPAVKMRIQFVYPCKRSEQFIYAS